MLTHIHTQKYEQQNDEHPQLYTAKLLGMPWTVRSPVKGFDRANATLIQDH